MTKCFESSSRLEIPRGHGQFSSPDKGKTAPLAAVAATSGAEPNEADLDIEEKILRRREMAHRVSHSDLGKEAGG